MTTPISSAEQIHSIWERYGGIQASYFVRVNYLEVMTAAAQRDACADAGNNGLCDS
ncbi:hypothetical protein DAPPUDRAFT_233238 [Daphnia pulex]|uniref:Uncharacterized protein n=1 Tax=Daphnia pulex TaxID=6669 RepID=E9FTL4_DAPPU|nr:hypothetical protein DAPPUDRAFT_233238 [Daphnia pulex]|eukprot:EFX89616.1 hypothetical protein DAPPUDRAFT_233238 [Daphnia pulex]